MCIDESLPHSLSVSIGVARRELRGEAVDDSPLPVRSQTKDCALCGLNTLASRFFGDRNFLPKKRLGNKEASPF